MWLSEYSRDRKQPDIDRKLMIRCQIKKQSAIYISNKIPDSFCAGFTSLAPLPHFFSLLKYLFSENNKHFNRLKKHARFVSSKSPKTGKPFSVKKNCIRSFLYLSENSVATVRNFFCFPLSSPFFLSVSVYRLCVRYGPPSMTKKPAKSNTMKNFL